MWLTTQSIKTSFFPTIWEIFKELDSLIALAICTAQTFPIRQAQQSDTPTTGSPGTHSVSLKLHQGKAQSSPAQTTTGYTKEHGLTGNHFRGENSKIGRVYSPLPPFACKPGTDRRAEKHTGLFAFVRFSSLTTHFQQPHWLHFTQIQPDILPARIVFGHRFDSSVPSSNRNLAAIEVTNIQHSLFIRSSPSERDSQLRCPTLFFCIFDAAIFFSRT